MFGFLGGFNSARKEARMNPKRLAANAFLSSLVSFEVLDNGGLDALSLALSNGEDNTTTSSWRVRENQAIYISSVQPVLENT